MKNASVLAWTDIRTGDTVSSVHTITAGMVASFAEITGDSNPLHMDPSYAATSRHGKRVVHGMLTASLLSEIVGMHLPGKYALILSQSTQFITPVFIEDTLTVSATVMQKSESTRTIILSATIRRLDELVLRGAVTILYDGQT